MEYQKLNLLDAKDKGAQAMVYLCPMCGISLSEACLEYGLECLSVMDLCPPPNAANSDLSQC